MRGGWRHFRLVLVCLTLSLGALSATHIAGKSVMHSIDKNARVILGGDWVLRQSLVPVGVPERDALRARGANLSDTAEARVMLINAKSGDSALVELKIIDRHYPLFGDATAVSGPLQDVLKNGVVMDPVLPERLGLKTGDIVRVGDAVLPVAGLVEQEPDRAGGGRFGLAPRVFMTWDQFDKTKLAQQGSVIQYDLRVRFDAPVDLKKFKLQFEKQFENAMWRLTDTEKASPQIQRFANNVMQFMTLIGLASLLISGIGVANGMRVYFASRLKTIAVFKSLGMTALIIRSIYAVQILVIAVLGSVAGSVLGAVAAYLLAPFLRDMLLFPLELTFGFFTFAPPLAFGVLTASLFAFWPLGMAERISALTLFRSVNPYLNGWPHRAMASFIVLLIFMLCAVVFVTATDRVFVLYFMAGAAICFALFYGAGRALVRVFRGAAPRVSLVPRLAMDQLGRTGNATAQTLISLGIGLTVLVTIALIERNLSATLRDNLPDDAPAFFFLDIQPAQKELFQKTILSVPSTRNLVMMPNLRGRLVAVNDIPAENALRDKRESWLLNNDRGFTYTAIQPAHSVITAGSWWPTDYSGPPLVSIVDDVQRAFGIGIGDKITVQILGRNITATVANVREVNWTTFTVNFAMTFSPGVLETAPHSWLATIVADPVHENAIQRAVTAAYPNISMVRVTDAINTVSTLLGHMNTAVRAMSFLALVTGAIVLAQALLATRAVRLYDTTILKVIGVGRRALLTAYAMELALLGFVAVAFALLCGVIISYAVFDLWMDLPWNFYPSVALGTACAGWLAVMVTGAVALGHVVDRPVLGYLRND